MFSVNMNIYVGVLFYRVFSIRCFKIIQYTCPFIIVKTKECWLNYEVKVVFQCYGTTQFRGSKGIPKNSVIRCARCNQ